MIAVLIALWLAAEPIELARRNAALAAEAFARSRRTMHAWLHRADPVTGLLPRTGKEPNWVVRDSAADLYPFLVICSYLTEPELYRTTMREILRREAVQSARLGRLSDDLQPGGRGFAFAEPDLDRIIFGSSEYAKDGLLAISEILGETPWYYRLRGIAEDIIRQAPYATPRGRLPSASSEVNGNMLQVLTRLAWKTGDARWLEAALAIGDFYLLDVLPRTGYLPPHLWDFPSEQPASPAFVLSDHGNEIAGGLSELFLLVGERRPDKARQYREPFLQMLDRLLEKGRNPDGLWVSRLKIPSGEITDPRHAHCWGYMFNAIYTAYLATGEARYREATEKALAAVGRRPHYLFDDAGHGRGWGANAYSDSIEGALVLLQRMPRPETEQAVHAAVRKFFDRQRPDGIIEDWYGDGNFIRTALMYALWLTQGTHLEPWREDLQIGAAREGQRLWLWLRAERPWKGRICLDYPRHRDHWRMARNYPRLNEWPEWYVVEQDCFYNLRVGDGAETKLLGTDLVAGVALELSAGRGLIIRVEPATPPPLAGQP